MAIREVGRIPTRLPAGDDHPYRTGAWAPNEIEYDADDLEVVEGKLPEDLDGVYLRNTENPVMPSIGRYHPFDGDGMIHSIRFGGGRASYRNRFVRTAGLAAELEAGTPLWAGIIEAPGKSLRDGWGARGRMKDASSTDVVVHNGLALTTFYQCGDAYQLTPQGLDDRGTATWVPATGISAHPKLDPITGELMFFSYSTTAPYMHYGLVDRAGALVHHQPIPLPGPRLPHDMAFTEHYAILNDFPLAWDADLIGKGVYRPKMHDLPSRFGVVPRRGGEVRWFEAAPTYVLHFINAYEASDGDGDTIVLDGYFQSEPMPRPDPADGPYAGLRKMVDLHAMQARPHRWRLDLRTGRCTEERLFDDISEFPSINYARPGRKHRYAWSMTAPKGWFLFDGIVRYDMETGAQQRFQYEEGVYASEAPMAPKPRPITGEGAEDAGWLVTFTTDVARDRSECHVFDASQIDAGPIAKVALPQRISSGTHACWAPASTL